MYAMQGVAGLGTTDVAVASTAEGAATKPSVWDQINKAITTAGSAAVVAGQVKSVVSKPKSGTTSTNPFVTDAGNDQAASAAPVAAPVDNTKKYLMIGGGLAVAAGVIFLAVKASKKKGKK